MLRFEQNQFLCFSLQTEHIKTAEECFNLVGSSASECDTIHGRQCMAAAFFLAGQFEEVLVYLTSVKSYLHSGIFSIEKKAAKSQLIVFRRYIQF